MTTLISKSKPSVKKVTVEDWNGKDEYFVVQGLDEVEQQSFNDRMNATSANLEDTPRKKRKYTRRHKTETFTHKQEPVTA